MNPGLLGALPAPKKKNVADELRRYVRSGIPFVVEVSGFEPPASRVQGGRSPD